MDDIVKDFLIESRENLDRLDQELVQLEADPSAQELLASIFRTIHTIKGSCGFLGFKHLEKLTHTGESLLSKLREGTLSLTREIAGGLLQMVDAIRQMLGEIQATGNDGANDYPGLREELKRLSAGAQAVAGENAEGSLGKASPSSGSEGPGGSDAVASGTTSEPAATSVPAYLPAPGKMGGLLVERGVVTTEDLARALQEQEQGDRRRLGEILIALGLCQVGDVEAAQKILDARGRQAGVETVRVGVHLLDELMNLVGELVLARNQLLQFSRGSKDKRFHAISQRINLVATRLQGEVMKTRMQPIANVWNKFPRTVRDLAASCAKQVRLEMEGQETELDRTIIEAIKDPLTHLVRNAVDHGLEAPDARQLAGKDATGTVKLRAFQESGQVIMEITDDGAGLNSQRIREKAVERGLIPAQKAARLGEREIFNLIFLPGFSTAEKITNVSGRGVGMDVVRTNVERIGGAVDIMSAAGQGTTVRVRIPLTLAIVPALMVRSSSARFAIPQMSLTELVRLEGGRGIERVYGAPVYRLRGQLLPLVYLREALEWPPGAADEGRDVKMIVVQAEGRQFGLVVDEILDTQEIVVKPLGKQLKGVDAYAGATILGDGSVALILDVKGLANRASILGERTSDAAPANPTGAEAEARAGERQTLVVAENRRNTRVAIPLGKVARLETFSSERVQRSGELEVMEYRGRIIPLLRLSAVLPEEAAGAEAQSAGAIQVVVCTEGGRTAGLIVDRILDIVEREIKVESIQPRHGIFGTCMIDQKITDVVDVAALVRGAIPGYLETAAEQRSAHISG